MTLLEELSRSGLTNYESVCVAKLQGMGAAHKVELTEVFEAFQG